MKRAALSLIFAVFVLGACDVNEFAIPDAAEPLAQQSPASPPKIVIVVIDGIRASEGFADSTKANIPFMWNTLRPQGTLCTNFKNTGFTATVTGHSSMVTGVYQNLVNNGTQLPDNPSLFEYYRKHTGAPDTDAVAITGKFKLNVIVNSNHPDYGTAYAGYTDHDHSNDFAILDRVSWWMENHQSRFIFASFPNTDSSGHSGNFSNYVTDLAVADSLVNCLWSNIQADSAYADNTYMFITTDHGRHDDAHGGFVNHGDNCPGCENIFMLALGPDIRQGGTVSNFFTQRDICDTAAHLLGVPVPYSTGNVIWELFEYQATGIE